MRQRGALARAFAQDADILLMDEPFGALDAMTRDALHTELEEFVRARGLTVLFVTHNVREAARLADRIVVMSPRPRRVTASYDVDIERPRRIESPEVGLWVATDHRRTARGGVGPCSSLIARSAGRVVALDDREPSPSTGPAARLGRGRPPGMDGDMAEARRHHPRPRAIWQLVVWSGWQPEHVLPPR